MTARRTQQLRIHAVSEAGPRWTRCHRLAAGRLLTGDPGRVTCKACLLLLRRQRDGGA